MPTPPLDPERVADIRRRYQAGEKYETICVEAGVGEGTLRKYCRDLQHPNANRAGHETRRRQWSA